MKLVFFDLETGGFDPERHPIIQIAAMAVDANLTPIETFEVKIKFDLATADPEALQRNSYHAETWEREAVSEIVACHEFSAFLKRHSDVKQVSQRTGRPYLVAQLIGQNADTFDNPFLQAWYKRLDQFLPAAPRVMCTYQRAMHFFHEKPYLVPPVNFRLEELAKYFQFELKNAHDALADVMATHHVYKAMRLHETALRSTIGTMLPWAMIGLGDSNSAVKFARELGFTSPCVLSEEEQRQIAALLSPKLGFHG